MGGGGGIRFLQATWVPELILIGLLKGESKWGDWAGGHVRLVGGVRMSHVSDREGGGRQRTEKLPITGQRQTPTYLQMDISSMTDNLPCPAHHSSITP